MADSQTTKHRKLIDIPLNILPKLEKMAKNDGRDLKNWIEWQLITLTKPKK